jgi:hypothetical protein
VGRLLPLRRLRLRADLPPRAEGGRRLRAQHLHVRRGRPRTPEVRTAPRQRGPHHQVGVGLRRRHLRGHHHAEDQPHLCRGGADAGGTDGHRLTRTVLDDHLQDGACRRAPTHRLDHPAGSGCPVRGGSDGRPGFRTSPAGGRLLIQGELRRTPVSLESWVRYVIPVRAPVQRIGGVPHVFRSWSDGKNRLHDIVSPAVPTEYVARFRRR